jgi:hypothetical protein
VGHACNLTPGEAEPGGFQVQDQPGLNIKTLSQKTKMIFCNNECGKQNIWYDHKKLMA